MEEDKTSSSNTINKSNSTTSSTSTSPIIKSIELAIDSNSESNITVERKMKRPRDTGPTTPRGEGDETKVLGGGLTPLAKKGRVQPDKLGTKLDTTDSTSDTSSTGAEDEKEDEIESSSSTTRIISTPPRPSQTIPPPGLESISAPPTPILSNNSLVSIKKEGLETMKIRERVQALEWEDGRPHDEVGEDGDTVIVDVENENENENNGDNIVLIEEGVKIDDVELKDISGEIVEEGVESKDVEITDLTTEKVDATVLLKEEKEDKLMEEVSEPIIEKKEVEEKDVEFAEVALEVGKTATVVHAEDDKKEEEFMETSEVAAEVGVSAKLVAIEDEKDEEIAIVAAEVADSAAVVQKEDEEAKPEFIEASTPSIQTEKDLPPVPTLEVVAPVVVKNSFSAFTSTSSPFSAFQSTSSPFGAVIPPPPPAQKPKSKTTFSTPALNLDTPSTPIASTSTLISSTSLPSSFGTPSSAVASSSSSASSSVSTPLIPEGSKPPPPTPSTPFGKSTISSSAAANSNNITASPFSAFSSSSGFASANTISKSSSGFGSYSAASASPFANIKSEINKEEIIEGGSSRKLGEPVEEEIGKRIFTEQELFTGEEDDNTIHTVRCKLFVMINGAWVERGTGILRLNVTKDSNKIGARLVMRADATHRLLLNATLFPEFSIEVSQEKYVRFAVIEETVPMSYMLRMAGAPGAQNLVDVVKGRVANL